MNMMLAKVFICGCFLALSTALPFGHIGQRQPPVPRSGFATAKYALIIGCDGFGKNYNIAACPQAFLAKNQQKTMLDA